MTRKKRSQEQAQLAADVGQRLEQLREEQHLSREQLVKRLGGGSQRAVANYEAGEVLLPTDLAKRICEEFGITFEWLMTGSGPRRQAELRMLVESRRADEETWRTLESIREVIERHGSSMTFEEEQSLDGIFQKALDVSLGRLEKDFRVEKGVKQFASFLDDLIVTAKTMWSDFGTLGKDVLISASIRIRDEMRRRPQQEERELRKALRGRKKDRS